MVAAPAQKEIKLRGAVKELRHELRHYTGEPAVLERLVEGPANTGKSCGIGAILFELATTYAGLRILVVRKTRASLTESFLTTWEQDILADGDVMTEGASRAFRHAYTFENGSQMVIAGLDQPTRHYSAQYDIVYVQEATEITLDEYERFYRMLRNWKGGIPFQLLVCDCNPDSEEHWLHKLSSGPAPRIRTLLSRHKHNPALWDSATKTWTPRGNASITILSKLTGVRGRRLFKGEWCSAAGAVWENFDRAIHLIDAPRNEKGEIDYSMLGVTWFYATIDWGFSSPGCMQVWGVDGDKRVYRVAEWYTSGKLLDWWTSRAVEAAQEFRPMRAIVADSADANAIETLNVRLANVENRPPVVPCDKVNRDPSSKMGALAGLDLVRERFNRDVTGKAHIYLVRDASRVRDDTLMDSNQPCSTEQEIPSYVYLLDDEGRPQGERVDPECVDHGCDAMRYGATWVWRRDLAPIHPAPTDKPGTIGSFLGHRAKLAKYARSA